MRRSPTARPEHLIMSLPTTSGARLYFGRVLQTQPAFRIQLLFSTSYVYLLFTGPGSAVAMLIYRYCTGANHSTK